MSKGDKSARITNIPPIMVINLDPKKVSYLRVS